VHLAAPAVEEVALGTSLRARLVNVLQGLEWQHSCANISRLSIPDQLNLALVFEENEAVFFRLRLALLNQGYEVALLGIAQFV
jgi:hypothetical protein